MADQGKVTPGALRMRAVRARRQQGYRCVTVELSQEHLDALVALGALEKDQATDQRAVQLAAEYWLDRLIWRA